uniref:Uncharacterized protein n=1 Tax=Physcomitrium patens TaxID=3218 RepID=A0A2K1J793_PHYPA|nr:hypothetical protein PHYPA_020513 [Physcomitrium patens]
MLAPTYDSFDHGCLNKSILCYSQKKDFQQHNGTSKSFKLQSAFQSQAFSRYHSKLHFVEGDQSLEAGLNWPQEPLTIVSPVATHSHYAQRVSARAPSNSVGVFSTLFHALLTGGCFFSISMLQRMSILEAGYSFVSVLGPIQKA